MRRGILGLSAPAPQPCPHPEEEHTSNTLSQAMGDQLRSPHWWLLEGQWHRGMLQASGWDRKTIAQCEGMFCLPKHC